MRIHITHIFSSVTSIPLLLGHPLRFSLTIDEYHALCFYMSGFYLTVIHTLKRGTTFHGNYFTCMIVWLFLSQRLRTLRIVSSLILFSTFHGNQANLLSPYCNDAYFLYFSTYLSTNMQFLRGRMEFNQVIPRLLHQREQQSEVKVPRRSRNVSHHHATRPIIHCRIRNMHVIALKPFPNNPSHVFGRCEVSWHVPNDWNVRHRRVHRCRNDHTHKHVVVSHNPTKSFAVAHHSDL